MPPPRKGSPGVATRPRDGSPEDLFGPPEGPGTGFRQQGVVGMTRLELQTLTKKRLIALARQHGVPGWHGMTKGDLVLAVQKAQRRLRRKTRKVLAPVQRAAARNTSG